MMRVLEISVGTKDTVSQGSESSAAVSLALTVTN